MKKIITMLIAMAVVVSLAAGLLPAVYAAGSTDTTGAGSTDNSTDPEFVRFIGDGFDPYASFDFSENGENDTIDPDTVRWAAIRYRTAAQYNEDNVEYISQFYVYPPAEPFIPVHYVYSGQWETVIVDMTSVAALYGRETIWDSGHYSSTRTIRLDPLEPDRDAANFDDSTGRGKVIEGDYIDIAWIAFFEKEEDAKAYTGAENTPYCLLDADSLSEPFSIHNLKAEYISNKQTPETTAEPGEVSDSSVLFALNYESELNDMLFEGNKNIIQKVYFNENCYLIELPAGSDPFVELCFGALAASSDIDEISADDYKVVQLGVRVNTDEGGSVTGNLYWQTDLHLGYSEPQNSQFKYDKTTDIQVINIDFTKVKKWEGVVGNLRYDPFTVANEDTEIELYYIAFFPSMESAEAFGAAFLAEGLPATPAPTEKPTAAPTAVPTEVPTAVPTEAATAVPTEAAVATDAPTDNSGNKSDAKSGNFPTGAVIGIVIGVVAIAAVISGVLISKSKKK